MVDKTKEQRYEELVNAMSKGELGMVKFLWNILDSIDSLIQKTLKDESQEFRKELNDSLKELRDNPPKDGKTPTREELEAIIQPLIPPPKPGEPGEPGKTPTEEELLELIESIMPETPSISEIVGSVLKLIPPPKPGKPGKVPSHRWQGTFIQFQNPDGTWGDLVNLQGSPAQNIEYGNSPGVIPNISVRDSSGDRFQGVSEIIFGANLNVTKKPNGVVVTATGGGGGGSINVETPTGTVDDSNVNFTVLNDPLYIVVNGAQYFESAGYSYSGGAITLSNPVGTGGFIRSIF